MSSAIPRSQVSRIRAAWILPVSSPPIESGEVVIEDGRIVEIRRAPESGSHEVRDFGDAIIMPGLVNVHTHLEYTVMRGLLEDIEFFPWIRQLTARKAAITSDEWIASATVGAAEAVAGGVTTIGDCTDSGAALFGAMSLGLGGVIYQEVFGIDETRTVETILEELRSKVDNLKLSAAGTGLQIGISPHAPYTVRPALMTSLAAYARESGLKICIHAAESQAEVELIRSGTGPIAEMFTRRGIHWKLPGTGAVNYLGSLGILGSNTLLVHGVQLAAEERTILEQQGVAWAHCPKSNAKLGNGIADIGLLGMDPARKTSGGQPRLGLGSDSVASNNSMDMFEEMRFAVLMQRGFRRKIAALTAKEVVEIATLGGAVSLGVDAETGSLEPGKSADICVVHIGSLHTVPTYDPYSTLVYAARASNVQCTMIRGRIRFDAQYTAGNFPGLDLKPALSQLSAAAQKMREWRSAEQ